MPGSIAEIAAALAAERTAAATTYEDASAQALEKAFVELFNLMLHSESDATRLGAAKELLQRIAPKEDDDARRREAEERQAAIAEARCLLAEFAAAPFTGADQPLALAEDRTIGTTDAVLPDNSFDVIA
jgi:L-lactate utilization protein LutC